MIPNLHCSEGEIFTTCANKQTTCRDFSLEANSESSVCIAGCVCGNNGYMDADGKCVSLEDCTCYNDHEPKPEDRIIQAGSIATRGCAIWYVVKN